MTEHTLHFQAVGVHDGRRHTDVELTASAERAEQLREAVLSAPAEVIDEYRIVADANPDFPTYDFTWRGLGAEEQARAFLELAGAQRALNDPTLLHRTVRASKWKTVPLG